MSSGSSGRYQSRLFNFVNQQSRRLTQQWESTFRHLQVATKLGVEALLYPVYLFLQSADSSVTRLSTKEQVTRYQLQSQEDELSTTITADTPIQHILETLPLLATEETSINSGKTSKFFQSLELFWSKFIHRPTKTTDIPASLSIANKKAENLTLPLQQDKLKLHLPLVRGIATDLVNRQLLLVGGDNEVFDILTPQQQGKLTHKIEDELVDYWQLTTTKAQAQLLPEIDSILAKLTGEQSSNPPILPGFVAKNLPHTGKIVALLDGAIAQLENTAILPIQQRSQKFIRVTQTQFHTFVYGRDIVSNPDNLENQKSHISELITAAVNYFFGTTRFQYLDADLPPQQLPGNSYDTTKEFITADPWLDWEDLYGDADKISEKIRESSHKVNPSIPAGESATLPWWKKLNPPQADSQSSLVSRKKNADTFTKTQPRYSKIRSNQASKSSIFQQQTGKQTQEQESRDWIEIQATLVGYEKHLLERVLEWLDRVMLHVEQVFLNIFCFFQGLLHGK